MDVFFEVSQKVKNIFFIEYFWKPVSVYDIYIFFFSEPATVKPATCNKAALSRIRSSLSAIVHTLSRLVGASGDEMNDKASESSVQDEH